jgi:hypothetical protein
LRARHTPLYHFLESLPHSLFTRPFFPFLRVLGREDAWTLGSKEEVFLTLLPICGWNCIEVQNQQRKSHGYSILYRQTMFWRDLEGEGESPHPPFSLVRQGKISGLEGYRGSVMPLQCVPSGNARHPGSEFQPMPPGQRRSRSLPRHQR